MGIRDSRAGGISREKPHPNMLTMSKIINAYPYLATKILHTAIK